MLHSQFSLADSNIVLVADYDVIRDNKWAPLCHQSVMFVGAARVVSRVTCPLLPHLLVSPRQRAARSQQAAGRRGSEHGGQHRSPYLVNLEIQIFFTDGE